MTDERKLSAPTFDDLHVLASRVAVRLVERKETVSVAESAGGGLLSAALLSVGGASAYFLGSATIYTQRARRAFLDHDLLPDPERNIGPGLAVPAGLRGATEAFASYLAEGVRLRLQTTWGLGETGAAGPSGNPYGDPAGHAWVAVAGPGSSTHHVLTGESDRVGNMHAFAAAALEEFLLVLR